jgi:hypothetical protein
MERNRAVLRCEIFPADLDVTVVFYVAGVPQLSSSLVGGKAG